MERRFPNNQIGPPNYTTILAEFVESGACSTHLVNEIETGDEGKLWSHIWEAMLYHHLRGSGYEQRGGGENEPDFRIEHAYKTIWIEAVVHSPTGIPSEYLEFR